MFEPQTKRPFCVRSRLRLYSSLLIFLGIQLSGCAKGELSCDSEDGRAAIVAEVSNFLNTQRCPEAIQTIDRFYTKDGCGTDNIRYARASAYACAANLNFFTLIDNLVNNSSNLTGNLFWRYLTELFPATLNDGKVAAGVYATEALMALRNVGTVTPVQYTINASTQHPGSLLVGDRQENANVYLMLTSMAMVGALQNEYGAPNGTYQPTQVMGFTAGNAKGWVDPLYSTVDSCTYASAILNMVDSMGAVATSLGSISTEVQTVATVLDAALAAACEAGCTNTTAVATGCAFAAGQCNPCPILLRDSNSCTAAVTDKETCAAAGIADFINANPIGWN